MSRTRRRAVAVAVGLALLAAGCGSSPGATPTTTTSTTTGPTTTTTTVPKAPTQRTVLSPTGLNVHTGPSTSDKVRIIAAPGSVFRVLGHVSRNGGWYHVRGTSVSGWITADPVLSAPGAYRSLRTGRFGVLYPAGWKTTRTRAHVVLAAPGGSETVVVTPASAFSRLPGVGAGYGRSGSRQVLVCGVTSYQVTYRHAGSSSAARYVLEIRLPVGKRQALGIYGHLSQLGSQEQVFHAIVNSVTFPAKQCVG